MSILLRKLISSRVNELTPVKGSIASFLELKQNKPGQTELIIPFNKVPIKSFKELRYGDGAWVNNIQDKMITSVNFNKNEVSFLLDHETFVNETFQNPLNIQVAENPGRFIVEFSSPNIAKPFHMGHLRSTIIGNFISNLLINDNHKVIKMNYLGDYGTQFGYLKVGIEMEKLSKEQIKSNPIECLFKAYVTSNTSSDPTVAEKARKVFESMENSEDDEVMKQWEDIKRYTMDELKVMYERLNVVFDVFEFESMYRRNEIGNILALLKEKNLLLEGNDGRKMVNVGDRQVTMMKSDSTSLYLTRDIAALIARVKKYKIDKTFYVVDKGQSDHFNSIKSIVSDLGFDAEKVHHIKFGRIRGMSTRKGSVVFLKDILEEAKDLMFKHQQESPNTKVNLSQCGESIAEILGISSVIVGDLKRGRERDYDFDWKEVLQDGGDTGQRLQYTHCRLHSLNKLCGVEEAKTLNLKLLEEPLAQQLIFEVLRYPEVVLRCSVSLESGVLVKYLFRLRNSTSKALKGLNVKNADKNVAAQRLLLFNTSRKILKHGMETLGLKVLNEM